MPGYRPPSSEPRGKWARAIHQKRRELNLSQQRGFELLGPALGFGPKSRYAYVALDMGTRQPTEAESKVLAEWLGGYPSEEPSGAGASNDTTVQLVPAAYLEAINSLVAQLTAEREQTAQLIGLVGQLIQQNDRMVGQAAIQFGATSEDQAHVDEAESEMEQAGGEGLPGSTPLQRRELAHNPSEGVRTGGPLVGTSSRAARR